MHTTLLMVRVLGILITVMEEIQSLIPCSKLLDLTVELRFNSVISSCPSDEAAKAIQPNGQIRFEVFTKTVQAVIWKIEQFSVFQGNNEESRPKIKFLSIIVGIVSEFSDDFLDTDETDFQNFPINPTVFYLEKLPSTRILFNSLNIKAFEPRSKNFGLKCLRENVRVP
jgi:hypothetical protein